MKEIQTATVLVIAILAMTGCGRDGVSEPPGEPAATAHTPPMLNGRELYTGPYRTPKGMKGLTITGYNYTDTYIDSFRVNGAGGGNVEVSTPTAGGGKGTCCAPVRADMPLPAPVEITWSRDTEPTVWCRQTVLLEGPIQEPANYFEVHFYQDGHIEVAISDFPGAPRVSLSRHNPAFRHAEGNVNNDKKLSECGYGRP
jgi:predicted small lipoprotein YifL